MKDLLWWRRRFRLRSWNLLRLLTGCPLYRLRSIFDKWSYCIYNVKVSFDWDAANIQHFARHGVTPREAEQAVVIDPLVAGVQSP